MTRGRAIVRRVGADLHLDTNLAQLDPCVLPGVFGALANHLGLDAVAMAKAARARPPGPPDPRYPELTTLIAAARRDWTRWGGQLVDAIRALMRERKLLPMTPASESALYELLRDHEVKLVVRFAGTHPDRKRMRRLMRLGALTQAATSTSYVDLAYRAGRQLNPRAPHPVRAGAPASLEKVVRSAVQVQLTPRDERALVYVKRRAAIYMRRPASTAADAADRALHANELEAVRGVMGEAVRARASDVGAQLREAVTGHPSLINDMDRVSRTELAYAHAFGAHQTLREHIGEAGLEDPWVFKLTSPNACEDCRRVWGLAADPNRYRLSHVEQREAAGGNFGMPREQWGPVIGPLHPHCTEGPLQIWAEELVSAIQAATNDFMQHWYGD